MQESNFHLLAMTIKSAAQSVQCSERYLWEEINAGRLKATRRGRFVRVTERALQEWLEQSTTSPFSAETIARKILNGDKR